MTIQPATAAPSPGSSGGGGAARLAETFDQFLTLLTTQLKHQNPLDPMDSSEFVRQLVQFTQVEQTLSTNKKLDDMIGLQTENRTVGALGYIGKTVEVAAEDLPLVDGAATLTYRVDQPVANAKIVIKDANGTVLFSLPASSEQGSHRFVWDGKGPDGEQLPDGAYKAAVSASDAEGNSVALDSAIVARVTGLESGEDGLMLELGPVRAPASAVVAVHDTTVAASEPTADATTTNQ